MFRIATTEDLDLIHTLLDDLVKDSKYRDFFGDYKFPKEEVSKFLGGDTDRVCYILHPHFEEPEGFFMFQKLPIEYSPFSVARIITMYIRPEFRGQGYMSSLLLEFEDWAREHGCKYTNIGVSRDGIDLANRGYVKYEVMYMKEIN